MIRRLFFSYLSRSDVLWEMEMSIVSIVMEHLSYSQVLTSARNYNKREIYWACYTRSREEKMLAIVTLKRQSKRKKTLKDLFESFCNKANVQERKKGPSKGLSSPFYFSFPLWLLLFNSIQLSDQSHITSIALYGPLKWFLMPKIPKMLNECKTWSFKA